MLMQIDGTFAVVVISFLIFLFIIKTILFSPITKVLEERENFYAKNERMETESKDKAKALIEEKDTALKNARLNASEIIKNTSKEAKEKSSQILKDANLKALDEIKQNENILLEKKASLTNELKSEVSNFVSLIVSKMLNENINVAIDDETVNKYLKIQ